MIVFDRDGSYYIILNLVQTRFYSHHSTNTVSISVTNDLYVTKCCDQLLVFTLIISITQYNWSLILFHEFFSFNSEMPYISPYLIDCFFLIHPLLLKFLILENTRACSVPVILSSQCTLSFLMITLRVITLYKSISLWLLIFLMTPKFVFSI